ncbi:MAG: tetratricopeptide repeat protein [Aminivibrio sp.]|jgi:tetratricopeptide (TPR) repeat protein
MRLISAGLLVLLFLTVAAPASAEEEVAITVEEEFTLEEEAEGDDVPDFFTGRDGDIFAVFDEIFAEEEPQELPDPERELGPIPGEEEAIAALERDPSEENTLVLAIMRSRYAASLLDSFRREKAPPPATGEFGHPLYEALSYAMSAAELLPDEPAVVFLIAQIYSAFGDNTYTLGLAEEALQRVLELNPFHSGARLRLGALQWRGRSFSAALDSLERAVSEDPALFDLDTAAMMGSAYFLENALPRGEAFFNSLLEKNEGGGAALFSLAVLLRGAGKADAAGTMERAAKAFDGDEGMSSYVRSVLEEWAESE